MARWKFEVGDVVRVKESERERAFRGTAACVARSFAGAKDRGVVRGRDDHTIWPYVVTAGKRRTGAEHYFGAHELELIERPGKED